MDVLRPSTDDTSDRPGPSSRIAASMERTATNPRRRWQDQLNDDADSRPLERSVGVAGDCGTYTGPRTEWPMRGLVATAARSSPRRLSP